MLEAHHFGACATYKRYHLSVLGKNLDETDRMTLSKDYFIPSEYPEKDLPFQVEVPLL